MAISIPPFLTIFLLVSSSLVLSKNLPTSAISAAPNNNDHFASPASSPDISPLFPSQGPTTGSDPDSSLPLIPSSPSPPNPDDAGTAFAPNAMPLQESSASMEPMLLFSAMGMLVGAFW